MINKFDIAKPVQTRDGSPVRILCTDAPGNRPIVALVGNEGYLQRYDAIGQGHSSSEDLVNVPTKHRVKFQVVVYVDGSFCVFKRWDVTPGSGHAAIRNLELEITEGEGL